MLRTQIYLTKIEKVVLDQLSRQMGRSQSELIRVAIDQFIAGVKQKTHLSALSDAAGVWAKRTDLPNFRQLRKTWDR